MTWYIPTIDGEPDPSLGAFRAPPPGIPCEAFSDDAWKALRPKDSVREWERFRDTLNQNQDWLDLLDQSGLASALARYVADRDSVNARRMYQALLTKSRLSHDLQADIAAAAIDCGLADLLQEVTQP